MLRPAAGSAEIQKLEDFNRAYQVKDLEGLIFDSSGKRKLKPLLVQEAVNRELKMWFRGVNKGFNELFEQIALLDLIAQIYNLQTRDTMLDR